MGTVKDAEAHTTQIVLKGTHMKHCTARRNGVGQSLLTVVAVSAGLVIAACEDDSTSPSSASPVQTAVNAALACDNVNEEHGLTVQQFIDTVTAACSDACIQCANAKAGNCDSLETCTECYQGDCILLSW
jgi:hypothetical protein